MKLDQYQRAKLNKILIIVAIVLAVLTIIVSILYFIFKNEAAKVNQNYEDSVVCKNLFKTISIDMQTKEVTRDGKETSLQEEFGIDEYQEDLILSSTEELNNYFSDSTIEVEEQGNKINLSNKYQTKILLVETDNKIRDSFDGDAIPIQENLYMVKYDTQKRTKAAYEFLQNEPGVKKVEIDEVSIVETINDESQTVYGEVADNDSSKAHGLSAMGIDNYKKIIEDNGNPSDIIIATIGYGAVIDHSYFKDRISDEYYNFIDDIKEIHESIPQGSRTLEVITESTTDNIKILPLEVINDEHYTTTASIVQALTFAVQKADVICYEFTHSENHMINLVLKNAFIENVPVCCVTKTGKEGENIFPASSPTTIAVSSVDKSLKTTSYSGSGSYIDFVASSTDVQEIFNTSSTVSKWSGAGYSNAHIVSLIALIKSYNKDATIEDVYNTLKNYSQDLGDKGKDSTYGHGFPNFSNIKISDIDKTPPELAQENVILLDENWEKTKKVQIKASDNIKIYGWKVSKSKDAPNDWTKLEGNSNTLDVSDEIKENGTYYAWVTDSAGNASYVSFEVKKVDNTPPKIEYTIDNSKLSTEKYVTINVVATDTEAGLHEMTYSWDKQNWDKNNNTLKVTENGTYTIYARDVLENISEQKIKINSLPKEGTADIDDGEIIKNINVSSTWNGNTNNEVIIILNNNLNIADWEITEVDEMPEKFRPSQDTEDDEQTDENTIQQNTIMNNSSSQRNTRGNTNVTITAKLDANLHYYLWVKDSEGNVISQGFTIRK